MKTVKDKPTIDLNPQDWCEVKRILGQYAAEYTVWVFGSRVTGTAKNYSDLDIVIVSDQHLTIEFMAMINDAFDESDLTIRVDVVDWAATSSSFRDIILKNHVVIQQGAISSSATVE